MLKSMAMASVAAALLALAAPSAGAQEKGWTLAWSDEFDGSAIDGRAWTYDLGAGGWGNNEAERYTDRPENARVEEGCLVIEARREKLQGSYYTSARLKTQGLRSFRRGRIEARIKVPEGKGLWPAFWLLGDSIAELGWPACGEIDVMEYVGKDPSFVYGTAHGPGYSGSQGIGGKIETAAPVAEGFHVFAVEWDEKGIAWLCDGQAYHHLGPKDLGGAEWVFDRPFFVILNLAVGGNWPGPVALDTPFPARMLVDYVRAYERAAD